MKKIITVEGLMLACMKLIPIYGFLSIVTLFNGSYHPKGMDYATFYKQAVASGYSLALTIMIIILLAVMSGLFGLYVDEDKEDDTKDQPIL